jgi:UDP-N-acetylmuramate dehydrogenase
MSAVHRRSSVSVRGRVLRDEPLAAHTSWRVGGPADRYFEPADREDLLAFIAGLPAREPITWLGLGSNLLVRDGGLRGTVICLHGALDGLAAAGDHEIYAEAGVHCARLAKYAQTRHRAGLGFMAGIPGTVGGALAMNAGAWGGETWPQVVAVEVVYRDARAEWLAPSDFHTAYRHVEAPAGVLGYLGARFRVDADPLGEHERLTREWLSQRKATQPVGKPTAGSTFRNPPGDYAARLIESCGLKGERIGGAEVSRLHANFIVTEAGAKAADVEALIQRIRDVVRDKTGFDLQPEVRIVGVPA